jgi:hypothetical protein
MRGCGGTYVNVSQAGGRWKLNEVFKDPPQVVTAIVVKDAFGM